MLIAYCSMVIIHHYLSVHRGPERDKGRSVSAIGTSIVPSDRPAQVVALGSFNSSVKMSGLSDESKVFKYNASALSLP